MIVYGYVRAARVDDDEGIARQRAGIERACDTQGGLELEGIFEDRCPRDVPPRSRPGWRAFILEVGRGDTLMVAYVLRISRDPRELLEALYHLRRLHVRLVACEPEWNRGPGRSNGRPGPLSHFTRGAAIR
jgi:DNA invertase Pin-like site-specific DNA recombinase